MTTQPPLAPRNAYRRDVRRPIPRSPLPERTLERCPIEDLVRLASLLDLSHLAWNGKEPLVRALGRAFRDPRSLQFAFAEVGTLASMAFLADLVRRGRIAFEDLPEAVLPAFADVEGARCDTAEACGWLHRYALVGVGRWRGRYAVFLPDDVRRPYAEALLGLAPPVSDARTLLALQELIDATPPPQPPWAPGYPTGRARRALPTIGPDRVLELGVYLTDIGVPIWRRLLVSYRRPYGALHEIIRVAFGWPQRSPHWFYGRRSRRLFAPPGRRVGEASADDEWKTPIRDGLARRGSRALYVIDPPTHWPHEIVTHAMHAPHTVPGEPYLLEAEGVHPPPDLGNRRAYGEIVAEWRRGERNGYLAEIAGPTFDPDAALDLDAINRRLAAFRPG